MSKKVIVNINTGELLEHLQMPYEEAIADILEPTLRYLYIFLVVKAIDENVNFTPEEINTAVEENVKIALARILIEGDNNIMAVKELLQ